MATLSREEIKDELKRLGVGDEELDESVDDYVKGVPSVVAVTG